MLKDVAKQEEQIAKMKAANADAARKEGKDAKERGRQSRSDQTDLLEYARQIQRAILEGDWKAADESVKATKKAEKEKRAARDDANREAISQNRQDIARREAERLNPSFLGPTPEGARRDNAREEANIRDKQGRERDKVRDLNERLERAMNGVGQPSGPTGSSDLQLRLGDVRGRLMLEREEIYRRRGANLRDRQIPEMYRLRERQRMRLEATRQETAENVAALGGEPGVIRTRTGRGGVVNDLVPGANGLFGEPITKEQGDKLIEQQKNVIEELKRLNTGIGETGVLER